MNNSESIREFFRRMADGTASRAANFEMLHNSSSLLPRFQSSESFESLMHRASERDFGIGLPPMANA